VKQLVEVSSRLIENNIREMSKKGLADFEAETESAKRQKLEKTEKAADFVADVPDRTAGAEALNKADNSEHSLIKWCGMDNEKTDDRRRGNDAQTRLDPNDVQDSSDEDFLYTSRKEPMPTAPAGEIIRYDFIPESSPKLTPSSSRVSNPSQETPNSSRHTILTHDGSQRATTPSRREHPEVPKQYRHRRDKDASSTSSRRRRHRES
jgi:hypothetical protein